MKVQPVRGRMGGPARYAPPEGLTVEAEQREAVAAVTCAKWTRQRREGRWFESIPGGHFIA